jgi:hypothetical protein
VLAKPYRRLDRASVWLKVANIAATIVLFVVFRHSFSWPFLAAIAGGGIDLLYPHVKRLVGLPDWTPNEAYITSVRRRRRAGDQADRHHRTYA